MTEDQFIALIKYIRYDAMYVSAIFGGRPGRVETGEIQEAAHKQLAEAFGVPEDTHWNKQRDYCD